MESARSPVISVKLELSPDTFHFSDKRPPTLSLHLKSDASRPITIRVGHGSPLDPRSAMQSGAFPIINLSTSPPSSLKIQDLTGRANRAFSSERRYLTIPPGEVVVVSVAFTRGGSYAPEFRPQPWEIVRRGVLFDAEGNERQASRSAVVCGCDGLEAGNKYKVTVAVGKLIGRSWWWGTEEEVRNGSAGVAKFESDGEELDLPLDYLVEDEGLKFSVAE